MHRPLDPNTGQPLPLPKEEKPAAPKAQKPKPKKKEDD